MTHLLDSQMAQYTDRLLAEVKVGSEVSARLATTIAAELRFLPVEVKSEILASSPIDSAVRLQELVAFQTLMDQMRARQPHPAEVRAQVVYQNYICFVYLGEACFRILAKAAPAGSASKRCSQFLSNNPVRAFRNALAHGNWSYNTDFSGLVFWSRKGSDPSEPLTRFEVLQDELGFWQALSRCVGYMAYVHVRSGAA